MTYEQTAAFFKLGLNLDSSRSDVKCAYAEKLGTCSLETNPEDWMLLHNAYEKASSAFDVNNDSSSDTKSMFYEDDNDEDDDSENDYVSFFQYY